MHSSKLTALQVSKHQVFPRCPALLYHLVCLTLSPAHSLKLNPVFMPQ